MKIITIINILLIISKYALTENEPPNPFLGKPQPFEENTPTNDTILNDSVDNFGFEPPVEQQKKIPPHNNPPPTLNKGLGEKEPQPTFQPPTNMKKAPKLADYLELDPAVKGLQVKNFDLPEKELRDVITLISKWTGKNFILDNKIKGKTITILGPSQVTLEEAYHAFLTALEVNGLTTVQSGKFIKIIEAGEARRSPVETFSGEYAPRTDQFITRIIQLKYISADEVQREFRDLVTRQGKLFAYTPTNSIIITDTGSNIYRIEEILKILDVKNYETSLHLIPIKNSSAKQISDMLGQIFEEESGGTSTTRRPRTFGKSLVERTRGGGVITKIIPDEQTNSLVVMANSMGYRQVLELVKKLDIKVTDTGKIHVYYCEYAKAEDLAQTLSSLASGSTSTPRTRTRTSRTTRSTVVQTPSLSRTGPISAELFEGVKLTADPATNALVITANAADFQTLKKVIRKLDIPRLQVFVETAILELTVDNNDQWNPNLLTSKNGLPFAGGLINSSTDLIKIISKSGLPEGTVIPIPSSQWVDATYNIPTTSSSTTGQSTINSIATKLPSFMYVLQIIAKTTNTSILSTPQIIALDNEEATFKVLDKIPVEGAATSGTVTSGSIRNIETKEIGIQVKLTPHINASSKTIRLEINQTVDTLKPSSFVPENLRTLSVAATSRETTTSVVVKDGDLLTLGGLMSDKVDEGFAKIPILGDIPILGWLFKNKTTQIVKTNLIFLIHPRIIGTSFEAAKLVDEKLKKRDKFIDEEMKGRNVHKEQVAEIENKIKAQYEKKPEKAPPSYSNEEEEKEEDKRSNLKDINPVEKEDEEDALMLPEEEIKEEEKTPPLIMPKEDIIEGESDFSKEEGE